MQLKDLNKIKEELSGLKKYDAVIYGSYAKGRSGPKSDIDIAIISRKTSYAENIRLWKNLLGKIPENYDLKVFELLPLEIKISVIKNYIVLFGDRLDISEYFYHFRKLWNDTKFRFWANQFSSFKEKINLMRKAKFAD